MKRIIVWVDSKSDNVKRALEELKKFLSSLGLRQTIVEICELIEPEDGK